MKFVGVRKVKKELTKIKANYQMDDFILLDSASQVTIFKQKDHVGKIFIAKVNHCTNYSGDGKSCINL